MIDVRLINVPHSQTLPHNARFTPEFSTVIEGTIFCDENNIVDVLLQSCFALAVEVVTLEKDSHCSCAIP